MLAASTARLLSGARKENRGNEDRDQRLRRTSGDWVCPIGEDVSRSAQDYHVQIEVFRDSDADMSAVITMNHVEEAIGIARAAGGRDAKGTEWEAGQKRLRRLLHEFIHIGGLEADHNYSSTGCRVHCDSNSDLCFLEGSRAVLLRGIWHMGHFTCYLCADTSFSIEPVASLWNTKLSSFASRSMHGAAVDAFVVLRVCEVVIDHPYSLHEGVADCRSHKLESPNLKVLAHGVRFDLAH